MSRNWPAVVAVLSATAIAAIASAAPPPRVRVTS
jgi:hypothetical protein